MKTADMSLVDYLGVGPLHETPTKTDCGLAADGTIITKSIDDLKELVCASPVPIVVGGGVKIADIPLVKSTGVDGFFVVSTSEQYDDNIEDWWTPGVINDLLFIAVIALIR